MSVRIINIQKEYEDVLYFLYPDYSMSRSVDFCVFTEDIKEHERLEYYRGAYSNAVIISRVLYDELWDVEKISDKVLNFRRVHFGCRKKSLKLSQDKLVEEAVEFIVSGKSPDESVEDTKTIDLFNSFGTRDFPYRFFTLSKTVPVPILVRTMLTFMTKVLTSGSSFYARFNRAYAKRMRGNLDEALRFYSETEKDSYGLYFVMFCELLTK